MQKSKANDMVLPIQDSAGRNHPQFQRLLKSLNEIPAQANDDIGGFPDIEKIIGKHHNENMTEPISRPELDAKLETIEARMDGRIARIEDAVQRISNDNAATRAGISSLKTTMIVTAIGAVLTIVLGVAAFNATLQSNMLNAFQAGQQTAKPQPPSN